MVFFIPIGFVKLPSNLTSHRLKSTFASKCYFHLKADVHTKRLTKSPAVSGWKSLIVTICSSLAFY